MNIPADGSRRRRRKFPFSLSAKLRRILADVYEMERGGGGGRLNKRGPLISNIPAGKLRSEREREERAREREMIIRNDAN